MKLIALLAALSISIALPIPYTINKCNDATEYYTTTEIMSYSIEYSITTRNNKTNSVSTERIYYLNPTFENYLDLVTYDNNITLCGKVILKYEIIDSCYYKCAIEIASDKYTSKTLAKYIENNYQPGQKYQMMCNSYGCHIGDIYCETFQSHDEL